MVLDSSRKNKQKIAKLIYRQKKKSDLNLL